MNNKNIKFVKYFPYVILLLKLHFVYSYPSFLLLVFSLGVLVDPIRLLCLDKINKFES